MGDLADFYNTKVGKAFFDRDMYTISKSLETIAQEMTLMRKLMQDSDPLEVSRLALALLRATLGMTS